MQQRLNTVRRLTMSAMYIWRDKICQRKMLVFCEIWDVVYPCRPPMTELVGEMTDGVSGSRCEWTSRASYAGRMVSVSVQCLLGMGMRTRPAEHSLCATFWYLRSVQCFAQ